MTNSLDNTMTKWLAVKRALLEANRGKLIRSSQVREHNAPTYQEVYGHFNNAFSEDNANLTRGGFWVHGVRVYFQFKPNKRQNITAAYNKLNNMYRELAVVRGKAAATSTIQRHWRQARPGIINKRKVTSLLTLARTHGVPNTQRVLFELAFPKPVYGPNNEVTALRKRLGKYRTY